MMYGVTIGTKDSLTEWGLVLLSDLSIEAPAPRFKFVTVPELDGALDLTESLTGSVSYNQRKISFTLFSAHDVVAGTNSPATEEHFRTVLASLMAYANGKRLKLVLPDDPAHYFMGRFSFGVKGGYNSGRVAVTVTVDPYRYAENGGEAVM